MTRARTTAWIACSLAAAWVNAAEAQRFRAPVTCTSCINYYYYLDEGLGSDWNCGSATYSGHSGTDYSLRSGNRAIDDNNEVVAMAGGVVVHAEDGYYDRCTQCGGTNCGRGFGNGFANQVIINHGAYRTIYGHMKNGSIAVKEGDMVECGQVIGFIGSSGCSTGAHLHIEPSLAANFGRGRYSPIDPYEGECSPTESSLFVDQGAYRTLPGATCDDEPPVPACPEDTYEIWTCTEDGDMRRRCVEGMVSEEACEWGCTAMPLGTDDVCALPPDADGDGSRADVDCDDQNAAIHPGAVEVCGDGIDQTCSGADMPCAMPPGGGASGGAGSGAAGATGGQSAPPLGQAGTLAPEPGQAGTLAPEPGQAGGSAAGGAGSGLGWPAMPAMNRKPSESGCSVREPGAEARSSALLLLALALTATAARRRKRR